MIMNDMKCHAYDCNANACVTPECYSRHGQQDNFFSKFRRFKDIENMHCICTRKETIQQEIADSSLIGT
jgi:hypothetical protein